jgi:hypothetical protein
MVRHVKTIIGALAAIGCMMSGCNSNSVGPTSTDSPPIPTGATVVFSDGFGGDLSKYKASYMINVNDFYSPMRITTDAAHSGTHSVTSDSNRTALEYDLVPSIISGIVGVQFYIMAKSSGQTNFTVQIGKNAGSSGGLGKQFGLGFDKSDFVKCVLYNMDDFTPQQDSLLAPIQFNHWYKCVVEINFVTNMVTYYLDDAVVKSMSFPALATMYGIDRLLVFRGTDGADGPKPYYADDIVLYKK